MTDRRSTIIDLAARCRRKPPAFIAAELRDAIVEAARTRNLEDREAYDAAHVIIDAAPGLFPLVGKRGAE